MATVFMEVVTCVLQFRSMTEPLNPNWDDNISSVWPLHQSLKFRGVFPVPLPFGPKGFSV